jgi:hypothetical protein
MFGIMNKLSIRYYFFVYCLTTRMLSIKHFLSIILEILYDRQINYYDNLYLITKVKF